MFTSQLRVKTKLMLGFAFLAAIVLVVSSFSVHSLSRSNQRFAAYLDSVTQREAPAVELRSAASLRAITARNLVLVMAPLERNKEKVAVLAAHGEVRPSSPS